MAWTDEQIALLREYWSQGLTASQIAEKIDGISRNAVIGKAHRLGLDGRPSPLKADGPPAGDPSPSVATPAPSAPKPARVRPSRAKVVKPPRTSLLDLNERVCKWPIGHPNEAEFHFCGKPVNPTFPYCLEHCAVAYQAQQPRRDRPRQLPPLPPRMR